MLTEDAITAPAHDVRPDRHLLLAVLSDPARVTASAVGRLDHEIGRLWTESDPARIVGIDTAALAVGRSSSCRTPLWSVVDSGRTQDAVAWRVRALALLCA